MADVKWIKMATNIFDNRKIRQIECLPDGYAIIVVWIKLLCLAGNCNDSGYIYFTKEIPYTEQMLSAQFNMPVSTVQLALNTFEHFEMLEIIDDIIHVSNWEKYQNVDGMERIKEQTRQRVAKSREKKKALCNATVTQCNVTSNATCNATVTQCNAIEEDKEKELEKEIREEIKENETCQQIIRMFNGLCPSLSSVNPLFASRKAAIMARLKTYTIYDFEKMFLKAESSDFLTGTNNRNWKATFDWLIKEENMAKVLDGNYDNRKNQKSKELCMQADYDFEALEKALAKGGD